MKMDNRFLSKARWTLVTALVVALLVAGMIAFSTRNTNAASWVPEISSGSAGQAVDRMSLQAGFSGLVKKTSPAVVNIFSSKVVRQRGAEMSPFFNDPMFRRFFGDEFGPGPDVPRERRAQSLGSGVIVNPAGYIVTNNHVVEGAEEIQVILSDKRQFRAKIIGTDKKTDLAILKVEAKDLPALRLGDSSKAEVGDIVLAIGNPFGIGQTVTMGIISATGRGGLNIEQYEDFIQTDAAINPGNSGGALINSSGELIGVNTAILSRSGGNQGVGFAIPSNMTRHVMQQIEKHGKVVRGYMGVNIQAVTPEMAKAFGRPNEAFGALIAEVTPDSPAQKAGLQAGDIITELNGNRVEDSRKLSLAVAELAPGTTARLKVIRDNATREFAVVLGQLPDDERGTGGEFSEGNLLGGVSVDDITPALARQLRISPGITGVVVTEVSPASGAAAAGLQRGDVIREVNRRRVNNVNEFRAEAQRASGDTVLLLVHRQGRNIFLVIESR
jgi:serine protease Do